MKLRKRSPCLYPETKINLILRLTKIIQFDLLELLYKKLRELFTCYQRQISRVAIDWIDLEASHSDYLQ